MISKSTAKFIKSLQIKKYRIIEGCFLVEGAKNVQELIHSDYKVRMVLGTVDYFKNNQVLGLKNQFEKVEVSQKELAGLGTFQANNQALGVAEIPPNQIVPLTNKEFTLVSDRIQDPGNLGTIVRVADWYNIKNLICSSDTADFYNPKVINATMGSFTRVNHFYTDLKSFLEETSLPKIGTLLQGEDVHNFDFGLGGLIILGNESHGVSKELIPFIDSFISIPKYGRAESLNVAVASAIICDNMSRLSK